MELILNQLVVTDNSSTDQISRCKFPNYIGRPKHIRVTAGALEGEQFVGPRAEMHCGLLTMKYHMEHGILTNWNDMERVWNYINGKDQLQTFSEELPVLLMEELFIYAKGLKTSVVLNSGDVRHSIPIYKGFAHSIMRVDIAPSDDTRYLSQCTEVNQVASESQSDHLLPCCPWVTPGDMLHVVSDTMEVTPSRGICDQLSTFSEELPVLLMEDLFIYAKGITTGVVLDSGDDVTHSVPIYEETATTDDIMRVDIAASDDTGYLSQCTEVTEVTSASQSGHLLPCYPCVTASGDMVHVVSDPTLMEVTPGGEIRPWIPAVKPDVVSPVDTRKRSGSKGHTRPLKKSRRSIRLKRNIDMLHDSGSDGDGDDDDDINFGDSINGNNGDVENLNSFGLNNDVRKIPTAIKKLSKKLRTDIIAENERVAQETEAAQMEDSERTMSERNDGMNEASISVVTESGSSEDREWVSAKQAWPTAAAPVDDNFIWSKDFSSFAGQKEVYLRVPGPSFSSQEPVHIFEEIWDLEFMGTIVRETNLYAWEVIAQLSDPDNGPGIPVHLEAWTDVTVEELYRYFSILILMSFCYRSAVQEYWTLGILEMPRFRDIMSRNRYQLISKFLHFVSNIDLSSRGHDRKIEKIAPVIDHCNRKFAALYTPSQHLSLDESLLLWKGRLSWKQSIRSKAARFGIKSFELCESKTGYLVQYRLYTGKQDEMHPDTRHGFQSHTAKVVLELLDGYLDVGHVLVMDNWYNQLPLTRYLKTRRHTDVLGTINRRRQGIPAAIKELDLNLMSRGTTVSRHSGDIALMAWKDLKLVTIMSTYHQNLMVSGKRAGQEILKPLAVDEYNRHMGGVDLKDQKLSMYPMERKRCSKWYLKVFKRLVNVSLSNAYIIYSKNPMHQVYTHRIFRFKVAEGLLSRYPLVCPRPSREPSSGPLSCNRLKVGRHFPVYTEVCKSGKEFKRLRCVRCYALKRRVTVRTLCELCNVTLCLGKCWKDYHTVIDLKEVRNVDV